MRADRLPSPSAHRCIDIQVGDMPASVRLRFLTIIDTVIRIALRGNMLVRAKHLVRDLPSTEIKKEA